jgi:hypothetical protein
MTKEQLAELLNGREYRYEITDKEAVEASNSGLVVVFGASDDLMEMRGAIYEEFGCYEGGDILFTKKGKEVTDELKEKIEEIEEELDIKINVPVNKITASYYPWTYETNIPHSTFDVMEDGEVYCKGIVFSITDLI